MHSSIRIAVETLELAKNPHYKEITTMQLLKLVYIAHGWMLGLYDLPLISDEVAWLYGPVIPNLYKEIKSYGGGPVESINLGKTGPYCQASTSSEISGLSYKPSKAI